jgi:uncharacterized protein YjbI with pentapeptide repeats
MGLHPEPEALRVFLDDDRGEEEVDLSKFAYEDFFRNDLVRYRITGKIPQEIDFRTVNFVGCVLHDVTAEGVDFSECDFKDTMLRGVTFSDCSFKDGTFATTFFSETEFHRCSFYNLAAHSSDFNRVHFIDCDLTNILVKSSRFSECPFTRCLTSNKVCELSTLFDVTFTDTVIQVDTITSNFGLTSDSLHRSQIRTGRTRETHDLIHIEDLGPFLSTRNISHTERLSFEFFLSHTLLDGSSELDRSLDIIQWTRIYKNPGSFVELLDKFAEFLVHLYDESRLAAHTILLLHHVTSMLTESVSQEEKLHKVAMSLGGIHLILSRIVEDYLYTLDLAARRTASSLLFSAEGPTDPDFFRASLGPWMGEDGVTISRLERNSPLIIEFTASDIAKLLPLLAAFLATRTKLEITRLKKGLEKSDKANDRKQLAKRGEAQRNLPEKLENTSHSVFSVSSGLVTSPKPAYEFRVRSLMPGSLLVDLKLNFSTTLVQRIRSILLVLLAGSSEKSS